MATAPLDKRFSTANIDDVINITYRIIHKIYIYIYLIYNITQFVNLYIFVFNLTLL